MVHRQKTSNRQRPVCNVLIPQALDPSLPLSLRSTSPFCLLHTIFSGSLDERSGLVHPKMRVTVVFEGSSESFDVAQDETVAVLKQKVKIHFCVQFSDDQQVQRSLELRYAGAALEDSWCLADVGISTGKTIHCYIKDEDIPENSVLLLHSSKLRGFKSLVRMLALDMEVKKALLHVFSSVSKETLPIMGTVTLLKSSVSRLRSSVSRQLGLPVSAFRLSTQSGTELYDCNLLSDYMVEAGDTLLLDTWDGWTEFLRGCFQGHKHRVLRHFSEEKNVQRFQKRVALYVAATHGHLEMSSWLLDNGTQAQEPVGVHPYRVWCLETDHLDALKSPLCGAVEAGQLLVLKMFLSLSVQNLAYQDPFRRNLLQIAVRSRHKECVEYLISKLYSVVTFPGFVLPLWLYVQIKNWTLRAKRRSHPRVQANRAPFRSRIGDTLLVDGFSRMFTKPMARKRVTDSSCSFQAATSLTTDPSCPSRHPAALRSQSISAPLPQLLPPSTNKRRQGGNERNNEHGRKTEKEILVAENTNQRIRANRSTVLQPHSSQDTSAKPLFINSGPNSCKVLSASLESFTRLCGRTPKENAVYCLAIASAFVEKPWLQQFRVAQTLARRSVQNSYKNVNWTKCMYRSSRDKYEDAL